MKDRVHRRRRPRRFSYHARLEPLEARCVLASGPIISEFQAINDSTLRDDDGEFSDWIEIENPTNTQLSLDGWYLTDDADDLTKWEFPAVSIGAGEQLVVFASDKNRTDPASPLHTNFRLSGEGEYLALIEPSGLTVAQEFAPAYPPQVADQSYGTILNQEQVTLLSEASEVHVMVPTNGALGTAWTERDFDDAAWQSGATGVGYEVLAPGTTLTEDFDAPLDENWSIDIPADGASSVTVNDGRLEFRVSDGQTLGPDRGLAPLVYRSVPNNSETWEIVTRLSRHDGNGDAGIVVYDNLTDRPAITLSYRAGLQVLFAANGERIDGQLAFGVDDLELRLTHDGQTGQFAAYYRETGQTSWTIVGTGIEAGGTIPALLQPRLGLFAASAVGQTVDADFERIDFTVGGEQPLYGIDTHLDVGDMMRFQNSSIYARIPFQVDGDPARFDELSLLARYDDGFIAYLNGVEVHRQNVPIVSSWNSSAEGSHGAINGELTPEPFSLDAFVGELVNGTNVLAIHGMNVAAGDDDFFMSMQLTTTDVLASGQEYFSEPTPGTRNGLPLAPAPIISESSGLYTGTLSVEMTIPIEEPGLQIRYTTNGSTPRANSQLYTGPISITSSTWLRAAVFDGKATPTRIAGPEAAETYTEISTSLRNRTSDLPMLILDTLGRDIPGTGSSTLAATQVTLLDVDPETGRSQLIDGIVDYSGRGGLRDRGSSTGNQPKQSYAFETWGQTSDDFDVSLLGMPSESDWVLFAPYNFDRALIRNPFIYELSNQIGRYAVRTRFVEVYVNEGSGNVAESDYVGVYTLMEKIKRDDDRVDIAKLDPSDRTEPEITGGYIFKIDRSDPGSTTLTAGGRTLNFVEPESNEINSAQRNWVRNYFDEFASVLNSNNFDDPVSGYAKYIDVDSWIDHHLLNVLSLNVDALRLSTYFYLDREGKIEFGPIWDFDRSMESTDGRDDNPNLWRGGGDATDFFNYPWWDRLFDDPNFWQKYIDRWHELRREQFSTENINALIDGFVDELSEAQARNFSRWTNVAPRGSWSSEIERMRTWLHDRAAFMDAQFAPNPVFLVNGQPLPIDARGVAIDPNLPVTITPPPSEIFTDEVIVSGDPGATRGRYFVPTNNNLGQQWTTLNFDDRDWQSGELGIGYENNPADYANLIRTRVRPADINSSATTLMTRIEFTIDDPSEIDRLVLRMKYDDGFVAYINGRPVANAGVGESVSWNEQSANHDDGSAVNFVDFDVSSVIDSLNVGRNVLAIQGVNQSTTSSDMLLLPELVSRSIEFVPGGTGTIYYTLDGSDPRLPGGTVSPNAQRLNPGVDLQFSENTRIIARNFDDSNRGSQASIVGTDWSAPIQYNLVVQSPQLVISELNYNPSAPSSAEAAAVPGVGNDDFEFIEVQNVGPTPLSLAGIELSDGVQFDFTTGNISHLSPGQRAVVVRDEAAFIARYGNGLPVIGTYNGNLNNDGEDLDLISGTGEVIFSVSYADRDPWPQRADGVGGTLVLVAPFDTPRERQNKHYSWRGSTQAGGTPGAAPLPSPGVVINEVLAHTDPPVTLADSIELFNTTARPIDIGGWYLSDSGNNLRKFRVPSGTVIPASGYVVFDESDFNPTPTNPSANDFALSGAKGDEVWLTIDPLDEPLQFVDDVRFHATPNGEALARVPNGTGRLTPADHATFGSENSGARVGPVILSEVNYHPGAPSSSALAIAPHLDRSDLEFVEIHNTSPQPVDLTEWRLRGGVDYNFEEGLEITGNGTIIVVRFNPEKPENAVRTAAFRAHYDLDEQTSLVGGYDGLLNNADELLKLLSPDHPPMEDPNLIPRLLEDELLYDDLPPWPTAADGQGQSLHRVAADRPGHLQTNWVGAVPSPGIVDYDAPLVGDLSGDGLVDLVDVDLLCAAIQSTDDPRADLNQDEQIDQRDMEFLIGSVLHTTFGDANLDGRFDSTDLILVFAAGQYEDGVAGNSSWARGDWNCDGEFDSSDLIVAFSFGGYTGG